MRGGSDIHIIAGTKPLFRVQRELVPFIQKEVITGTDTEEFFRIIAGSRVENAEEMLKKQKYLMFSYIHTSKNDTKVNLRVTAYYEMGNITIAMRLVQAAEKT